LGVLEEDVRLAAGSVEVEEAEIEKAEVAAVEVEFSGDGVAFRRQAVRCGEAIVAVGFGGVGEEDGDFGDKQGMGSFSTMELRSACRSVSELRRGRIQRELCGSRIVAVEDLIYPGLEAAFQRIEQLRGDEDGDDESPFADCFRQVGVDLLGDERDGSEVDADQRAGGEGVGHAALEDEVGIHEPVANDGPAKGQRKERPAIGQLFFAVFPGRECPSGTGWRRGR